MTVSLSRERFDAKWEPNYRALEEKLGSEGCEEFFKAWRIRWLVISEQVEYAIREGAIYRCREYLALFDREFGHLREQPMALS